MLRRILLGFVVCMCRFLGVWLMSLMCVLWLRRLRRMYVGLRCGCSVLFVYFVCVVLCC